MLQADALEIQDDWSGMATINFVERHYMLTRQGEHFRGTATFRLNDCPATAELSIPSETVEAFLKQLSQSPLYSGTYVPEPTHTDDYPERKILVRSAEHTFTFVGSQDRNYWQLTRDNETHTIISGNLNRALALLAPHLRPEVYQSLEAEALAGCKNPPAPMSTAGPPGATPALQPTAKEGR